MLLAFLALGGKELQVGKNLTLTGKLQLRDVVRTIRVSNNQRYPIIHADDQEIIMFDLSIGACI